MAKHTISMASGAIALSNRVVDKLLAEASGDAALLYLYLLRQNGSYDSLAAGKALRWTAERLISAMAELERLELVKGPTVDPAPAPTAKDAPTYTAEAIRREIEQQNSPFPGLVDQVERCLGDKLTYQDLQKLMELYDYLGLPAEVIFLLVNHMMDETVHRKGPGRLPKMWEIKREGYSWAKKGIDTLEAATAYMKKVEYFRTNEGQLLSALGINGRTATEKEKTYLSAWLDWGFHADGVQLAFEQTMFHKREWNWNYCSAILKRWHQAGLHTAGEILAAQQAQQAAKAASSGASRNPDALKSANRNPPPQTDAQQAAAQSDDIRRMQNILKMSQGQAGPQSTGGN